VIIRKVLLVQRQKRKRRRMPADRSDGSDEVDDVGHQSTQEMRVKRERPARTRLLLG
jgi:hypothetical protein